MNAGELGADILALDAHKFYGPHTTGLLYVKNKTPCIGFCGMGGQMGNEGTPDVAALLGMGKAFEILEEKRGSDVAKWAELKTYFLEQCTARFPGLRVHGAPLRAVPTILNISFPDIEAEFLVTQLDRAGVAASAKSACLSGGGEGSYVVQAVDPDRANNSIRFSFGRETTQDDIDYVISALIDIVRK